MRDDISERIADCTGPNHMNRRQSTFRNAWTIFERVPIRRSCTGPKRITGGCEEFPAEDSATPLEYFARHKCGGQERSQRICAGRRNQSFAVSGISNPSSPTVSDYDKCMPIVGIEFLQEFTNKDRMIGLNRRLNG